MCVLQPGTALESLVTGTGNGVLPTNIPALNANNQPISNQQQQQPVQGRAPSITNNNVANGGNGFWY